MNMNKILCVISCPADTYSGYGARSRDIVRALIKEKGEDWDIKIISQRWGECPWGYLKDHNETDLQSRIVTQLHKQPEIWIQITVPNEFQPVGKYNIGITAGIETTVCDASWIEGCNRMNLILTSSEHSKKVFETTSYQSIHPQTKQAMGTLKFTSKCEVLFEGVDLSKYFKFEKPSTEKLTSELNELIKEDFAFLFVGHWMQGELGQDRKDVGMLCKVFLELFKNKKNPPALILKTSGAGASNIDKTEILKKLEHIRNSVKGELPNIYLIHGELTDEEINELYNHSKVKAMVSFTKGEGYGRPLAEFGVVKKPILAPSWSGQLDFLNPEYVTLIKGKLTKIHPSAVINNMILADSEWFTIDYSAAGAYMKDIFENYKNYQDKANRQSYYIKTNFSLDLMSKQLGELLTLNAPQFPVQVPFQLPQLKKINLPSIKKIDNNDNK